MQLFTFRNIDADNSSGGIHFLLSRWQTIVKLLYFFCWLFQVFLIYCFFHYSLRECLAKNYYGSCELILGQIRKTFAISCWKTWTKHHQRTLAKPEFNYWIEGKFLIICKITAYSCWSMFFLSFLVNRFHMDMKMFYVPIN